MGTLRNKLREERGVVFILVIIALVVLLAFAALALDVGNVMVVRNELQNISDGAALAATRNLGDIYERMSYADQEIYNVSNDAVTIKSVANEVATLNKASGAAMEISVGDVKIGRWNPQTKEFTENMMQPDAVWVKARKDASLNSPVTTFFARIFGMNTVDVSATAIAALTGQSTAAEGGLPVPLGISQVLAGGGGWCGSKIKMHPTKTSCAGWHTFTSKTHSSSQLEQILQDYLPPDLRDKKYKKDPTFESPEVKTNDTLINFTGGDLASNFDNFENLFNYMKTRDGDDLPNVWTTAIVIYKEESLSCGNPSGDTPIVGFATMKITEVFGPSAKEIWGEIQCGLVDEGRSGGGNYGTKGSIPGLVQ